MFLILLYFYDLGQYFQTFFFFWFVFNLVQIETYIPKGRKSVVFLQIPKVEQKGIPGIYQVVKGKKIFFQITTGSFINTDKNSDD